MSSYSIITLDSHEQSNKNIHRSNNANSFRINLPKIHYEGHSEIALQNLTYHHVFYNVHHYNKRFYVKIALPKPFWRDYFHKQFCFNEIVELAIPDDDDDWPVDDLLNIDHWRNTRFDKTEHQRFWYTKIFECELPMGAHRDPKLLIQSMVANCRAMPGQTLLGIPIELYNVSKQLFKPTTHQQPDPIESTTNPQLGFKITSNIGIFFHKSIANLLGISTPHKSAEFDADFVNYVSNYKIDCFKPTISKFVAYNSKLLQRNELLQNMARFQVSYKKKEAELQMSQSEIYLQIFCDAVKATHVVNDKLTRMLYSVRRHDNFGAIVTLEPRHLMFLPTVGANLNAIQIDIKAFSNSEPVILLEPATITLRVQSQFNTLNHS